MSMTGRAIIVSAALLLGAACGPSDDDGTPPACGANLLAGDLVITEVFADADGEDEGKEWFEIYNATNQTLDLAGVVLTASKANGDDPATHVMTQQIIDPGQYLVLGGVAPEFRPSFVDYGYGPDLRVGSARGLPNADGKLDLKCDVVIVDEMTWSSSSSGKSKALDGSRAPDYNINDDQMLWCDSITEFELGSFGTPQNPNDACSTVTPTMCNDGGTARELVSPELGDVVITEYMARPSSPPGAATGEWLELAITRDVDLNGLQLGQAEPATGPKSVSMALSSPDCLRFTAGNYVLLARGDDPLTNGGLPALDGVLSFGLTDSDDGVFIGFDGAILDVVTWVSTRPQGKAVSLDPAHSTPTDNDDDLYWCDAVDAYGTDGQLGTPKAENPNCDIPPPDGMCFLEGGGMRAIVKPTAGQLVVSEWMARPPAAGAGGPGTDGEWLELEALADFDLNGVELGRTPGTVVQTITDTMCRAVTTGDFVLLVRTVDAGTNGGIDPGNIDGMLGFGLTDSNSGAFVGIDATTLDSVTWTSSTTGVSVQRDPVTPANFCAPPTDGSQMYGSGGHGTPNATNVCAP